MKAYTGSTGYVYQYYFVGERPALPDDPAAPATEFIFDVTADRKVMFAVSVFLKREALDAWATAHGRSLNQPEQYAAAKMRLFAAFDEIDHMQEQGRRLIVDGRNVTELLDSIGLE
jgi:hypothetical protein